MRVYGGMTNAGWRRTKETPKSWECPECEARVARYFVICPSCKSPKPED